MKGGVVDEDKKRLLCRSGLTNSFKCKIGAVVSNILLSPLGPTFVSPDKLVSYQ